VRELARARAASRGLDPDLGERLVGAMIEASLTSQERDRLEALGAGAGRARWSSAAPAAWGAGSPSFSPPRAGRSRSRIPPARVAGLPWHADWHEPARRPNSSSSRRRWPPPRGSWRAGRRSARGLVVEIGSIKAPVAASAAALRDAGVAVASIHPMFGPDVRLLAGRPRHPGRHRRARGAGGCARPVRADLGRAWRRCRSSSMTGWSRGCWASPTRPTSPSSRRWPAAAAASAELAAFASTTFGAQLRRRLTRRAGEPGAVLRDPVDQPARHRAAAALAAAAAAVERAVEAGDAAAFTALMRAGARYLEETRA
jgi:chorismate mutase / prephenate dehydrogenase